MQVQNASTLGPSIALSSNVTWLYPNLPGDYRGALHRELAVCVPSNVTIASICCPAASGQFVAQEIANVKPLQDSEVRDIFEDRYPGQNLSIPIGTTHQGDLVNAMGAGGRGAMNWCSLPYSPSSEVVLEGIAFSPGSANVGNVPQSILDWIACFKNNTSNEARSTNQVVYACTAVDVRTGGRIEGFNRTFADESHGNANGGLREGPSLWAGILGVSFVAGLWSICI